MKKLKYIIATLLILIFITGPAIQSASAKDIIIGIKIEIVFGRKSKDCKGWGICYFTIEVEELSLSRMGYIPDSDEIQLAISKETFAANKDQFEGESFRLEEDVDLPDEVIEKLEIGRSVTLPAGEYRGEWLEDYFVIRFPAK